MAEFVPDLALQQAPVESMAALRGDAKKEADELSVFREFTKRSCVTLRMKLVHERKRVMGLAVVLVPLGGLIAFGPSLEVALLLAALVAFSHLTWQVTMGAL
ncbi:MAG: hypothetical protein HYZ57_13405, partial [Acidobacteria bacterium]|nr:hypothetical protein [Acidobacteriota bacterium]